MTPRDAHLPLINGFKTVFTKIQKMDIPIFIKDAKFAFSQP